MPLTNIVRRLFSKPQYKAVVLFICIYVCLRFFTFRLISFHFFAYLRLSSRYILANSIHALKSSGRGALKMHTFTCNRMFLHLKI